MRQSPRRIIRNSSHVAELFGVLAGWAGVEAGLTYAVQISVAAIDFTAPEAVN